jgi:hypothetical protein
MSTEMILDETTDFRPLTETELDDASGALLPLIGFAILGFSAGAFAGGVAANYYYTGNFWGDWDFE